MGYMLEESYFINLFGLFAYLFISCTWSFGIIPGSLKKAKSMKRIDRLQKITRAIDIDAFLNWKLIMIDFSINEV